MICMGRACMWSPIRSCSPAAVVKRKSRACAYATSQWAHAHLQHAVLLAQNGAVSERHLCVLRAVVGQGKIVEMGGYAELAAAGGAFTSLMKIQMMGHEGQAAAGAAAGDVSSEAHEVAELARLSSGVQGDVKVVNHHAGKVGPTAVQYHSSLLTRASQASLPSLCHAPSFHCDQHAACAIPVALTAARLLVCCCSTCNCLIASTLLSVCWPAIAGSCMA